MPPLVRPKWLTALSLSCPFARRDRSADRSDRSIRARGSILCPKTSHWGDPVRRSRVSTGGGAHPPGDRLELGILVRAASSARIGADGSLARTGGRFVEQSLD